MVLHVAKDDIWSVCSGVVDRVVGLEQVSRFSLEKIVQHEFVGDTRDGGLAVALANFHGHSVPLFDQGPDGPLVARPFAPHFDAHNADNSQKAATTVRPTDSVSNQTDEINGTCQCGGVKFRITRPNSLSSRCSSPFPDLLAPYHLTSSQNPHDEKWWLRASGSKYLAGTCACRSCRLGAGSPIQCWAFVPKANILQANNEPISYDMGSLKQIESSKDCFREFCGVCGATVFWHCKERPELIDVSVGLLQAWEGSRAESLLEWWTGRVSFREDALDKELIEALEQGLLESGLK
ncbi:hypothetical protein LTS17_003113 [Exophiala oligosperma]